MQFKNTGENSYVLKLSADNTWQWARRPGESWPCSTLAGKPVAVQVDSNGLCDLWGKGLDTDDVDGNELDAIVADHLPESHRHLWPTWE